MDNSRTTEIIRVARTYLGTPYHHLGRVKNIGIDCLGLVICVAQELGLPVKDKKTYSRYATGLNLFQEFGEQCQPCERGEGAILIFATRKLPNHCGIESRINGEPSVIHAYGPSEERRGERRSPSEVVEHLLGDWWEDKIVGIYNFPRAENVKQK